jgi:YVTN family beta-propeller protein
VLAGAIAAIVVAFSGGDDGNGDSPTQTSTARVSAELPIGRRGNDIVYAAGKVWVTSFSSSELLAVDERTNATTAIRLDAAAGTAAIAAGYGALWVANARTQTATRVDLATHALSPPIALPRGQAVAIAAGARGVWVGSRTGGQNPLTVRNVVRIDPTRNTIIRTLTIPNGVQHLAVGNGAVWVVNRTKRVVTRVDVKTGTRANVPVGHDPQRVAVGAGFVWVTNGADGTVSRIDPRTLSVSTVGVGRQPVGVDVGGGSVWVANRVDSTVSRIDPASAHTVGDPIPTGLNPTALTVHGNRVWVTTPGDGGLTRIEF